MPANPKNDTNSYTTLFIPILGFIAVGLGIIAGALLGTLAFPGVGTLAGILMGGSFAFGLGQFALGFGLFNKNMDAIGFVCTLMGPAVAGTALGAFIGSVVPGIGTLIGALVGAALGCIIGGACIFGLMVNNAGDDFPGPEFAHSLDGTWMSSQVLSNLHGRRMVIENEKESISKPIFQTEKASSKEGISSANFIKRY